MLGVSTIGCSSDAGVPVTEDLKSKDSDSSGLILAFVLMIYNGYIRNEINTGKERRRKYSMYLVACSLCYTVPLYILPVQRCGLSARGGIELSGF